MSSPRDLRRYARKANTESGIPKAKFSQLLPYLGEHRRALTVAVVLSVLGAAASLAQPLLVGQVITRVTEGELLGPLVWILVSLVALAAILSGYQHYLLQRTGEGVVFSSRRRLVARLLRLPISEFDARRTGDLVSRVGADTTLLRAVLTQGLVDAVGGALTFVGAIIGMAILDPVLLGLTVLVVFTAVTTVTVLSRRIRVASAKAQEKVGELAASVERAISAVRTVRAANATDREIDTIIEEARGAYLMGIKVARISALVVPIAGIALQVAFLTVLGVGGYRVADGAITVANLVTFILFLFMMIMPLGQAFGAITSVNSALGALGRIQEIIAVPSEGEQDRTIAPLAVTQTSVGEAVREADVAIEFDQVRFSYPKVEQQAAEEEAPEILRGVSFRATRGTRTALVGPSGAGKSTILGLIERFYDPSAGVIRLGGTDIRELNRADLRSQIGYVEQDAPVLAGSLRENLKLGAPNATDEQCIQVLTDVNLTNVLRRTSLGLDAPVGEEGVMLSGGERQRLAIARALLAAPPILLLDESTASLDGANEQLMREAIDKVAQDRTLIIIAHRLSTVVDSEQIIVLDHGTVVGTGTHSQLVTSTPLYKELAKHQLLV